MNKIHKLVMAMTFIVVGIILAAFWMMFIFPSKTHHGWIDFVPLAPCVTMILIGAMIIDKNAQI